MPINQRTTGCYWTTGGRLWIVLEDGKAVRDGLHDLRARKLAERRLCRQLRVRSLPARLPRPPRPGLGRRCRRARRPAGQRTGPPLPSKRRPTPFRDGLLVWERPEGAGPGVRKRARPRTRSRPSDCRVAPSPTLAFPAVPAARQRDSQDLCVQELPPPRRCARPERRGAHRHPMSFSRAYAVLTQGTGGAQIIGRGLPRERGRRGQPSRGDSPGSSSTPPG